MNTKKKNVIRNLLEIRADFHKSTFGKSITWEIRKDGHESDGTAKWYIEIYEHQSTGASHNYEIIGQIAEAAMASHWLSPRKKDGESVIKFHLY